MEKICRQILFMGAFALCYTGVTAQIGIEIDESTIQWIDGAGPSSKIESGLGILRIQNPRNIGASAETFFIATADASGTVADRMAIEGDGDIGIGYDPDNARSAVQLNHRLASGSLAAEDAGVRFQNEEGASKQYWAFYIRNGDGAMQLHSRAGGAAILGTFNAANGDYSSMSDARYKSQVDPMQAVLNRVLRLNPVNYFFKHNPHQKVKNCGFLAQEVESIFPELVNYDSETDMYGINYAGFSTIAIKAIQEQQNQIRALTSELAALKASLTN